MRSSGKTIGLGMIAAGAILGIAGGAWLISGINEDKLEQSGAIFGLILLLGVVVLPLVGGGIFFARKGAEEEKQMSKINEQRHLLDIVSPAARFRLPIWCWNSSRVGTRSRKI